MRQSAYIHHVHKMSIIDVWNYKFFIQCYIAPFEYVSIGTLHSIMTLVVYLCMIMSCTSLPTFFTEFTVPEPKYNTSTLEKKIFSWVSELHAPLQFHPDNITVTIVTPWVDTRGLVVLAFDEASLLGIWRRWLWRRIRQSRWSKLNFELYRLWFPSPLCCDVMLKSWHM